MKGKKKITRPHWSQVSPTPGYCPHCEKQLGTGRAWLRPDGNVWRCGLGHAARKINR